MEYIQKFIKKISEQIRGAGISIRDNLEQHAELRRELKAAEKMFGDRMLQTELDYKFLRACNGGNLAQVQYLLTSPELLRHADVHMQNDYAAALCVHMRHFELADYLLHSPELTEHAILDQNKVFLEVCQKGEMEAVVWLHTHTSVNVQHCRNEALILAAQNQHTELLKYLLSLGADIHAREDECFKTVCRTHNMDLVRYLLIDLDLTSSHIQEYLKYTSVHPEIIECALVQDEKRKISAAVDKTDTNVAGPNKPQKKFKL